MGLCQSLMKNQKEFILSNQQLKLDYTMTKKINDKVTIYSNLDFNFSTPKTRKQIESTT